MPVCLGYKCPEILQYPTIIKNDFLFENGTQLSVM